MRARVHALVSSWTLVTSSFSHADTSHALFNGLTFWFLAPTALAVLGNAQFLVLYLGSASTLQRKPEKKVLLLNHTLTFQVARSRALHR